MNNYNERNKTYNEAVNGLIDYKLYDQHDNVNIKKFKIMLALYRDHAREFKGEMNLGQYFLIYDLSNTKKSHVILKPNK